VTAPQLATAGDRRRGHSSSSRRFEPLADADRTGPINHLSIDGVLTLIPTLPTWSPLTRTARRYQIDGARTILEWLATFPGEGWQQRWIIAGAYEDNNWVARLVDADTGPHAPVVKRNRLVAGALALLLVRAVLPGYGFLHAYRAHALYEHTREVFRPDLFAKVEAKADALGIRGRQLGDAILAITRIVLHTGKDVDQLSGDDLLELRWWYLSKGHGQTGLALAWRLLHGVADLGSHATMLEAIRLGQRPTSEIAGRYGLCDSAVRTVLVRYFDERRPGLDYDSFEHLAGILMRNFWADIEHHHPGLETLHLPPDVVDGWKQRLRTVVGADGTRRNRSELSYFQILVCVRSFYLDIQEWAMEDPTWAQWAAPSPVRRGETDGFRKSRTKLVAKMHQRVRDRLPRLPALVNAVEDHLAVQTALLTSAAATPIGKTFAHNSRGYQRIIPSTYHRPKYRDTTPPVLVEDLATGKRINLSDTEDEAFWSWAIVETLRHTGVRVEELTELTHLALVSYRLPDTGEIVPMLQIVPSKTNVERLLLVGPELANVLAAIITRLRNQNGGTIALTPRYDPHERTTGPALPHLFQRRRGAWRWSVISANVVSQILNRTLERCDLRNAAGEPLRFTAHDFRRMFATEAVNDGLPVHIVARLLGHANLNTSHAYMAVFDDHLVRTYRAFLDERRAQRPEAEYREPTDQEWRDFQQHFQERKLELGECGRPYGTSCKHEHACIRCPSLRLDPAARPRLIAIIANLKERIAEARLNGWLGEVQGLQISLDAAANKLANLERMRKQRRTDPVSLGIPIIADPQPLVP
jgi:site-specific recombinase XerD